MKSIKHLKIAGALQVAHGILFLVWGAIAIVKIIPELQAGSKELGEIFEFLPTLMLALVLLGGGVMVWFGISLVMQKQWTRRIGGFICCVPGLVAFPVGTAISGYTLWVLVQVKKREARMHEPVN